MPAHPSPDVLERYGRGDLSPEELLAVDDHLAACPSCRETAKGAVLAVASSRSAGPLDAILTAPVDHPAYEAIEAYVEGTLDDVAGELMDTHLADCEPCREEIADLRAFRQSPPMLAQTQAHAHASGEQQGHAPPDTASAGAASAGARAPSAGIPFPSRAERAAISRRRLGLTDRPVRLAFALAAAATLVWFLVPRTASRPASTPPERAAAADPRSIPGDPSPSASPGAVPLPAPVATLRDGGGLITVDVAGSVTGTPSLSVADRTVIAAALMSRRMPLPEFIREIAAEREVLRGGSPSSAPFSLRDPIGTAVETDRPVFRWDGFPTATAYVVSVYDDDFTRVAQSPALSTPEWTSDRPLARGRTYTWNVSASTPSGEIAVPTAPAPQARFIVLTQPQVDTLARVRRVHPDAHLLLAVSYARVGVRSAAERELRALQRANPDAAIVRALLESLR